MMKHEYAREEGRTSKILLAAVLLFVLAATGVFLCLRARRESARLPADFFSGLGEGRMYRCVLDTRVDYGASEQQSALMEQHVEGTLNVRLLSEEPRGAVLAVQFSPIGVSFATDGRTRESEPRVLGLLGQMFLVGMSRRGAVERFDFPPSLPPHLTSILEGAFRSLQILLPPEGGTAREGEKLLWRTVERDANGECLSAYSAEPDGTIRKRRLSYAGAGGSRDAEGAMPLRISILSSDIRAEIDDGWIKTLHGYERSEFFGEASSRLAAGENRFTLEALPFSPDRTASIWQETRTAAQIRGRFENERNSMAAARRRLTEKPVEPPPPEREPLYDAELAMRFVPELATEHARLTELVAWLDANPEAALRVPGLMLKIEDDALRNYIILALQQSGTPHAQSALCSILRDPIYGRMDRLRATAAFSFVRNPTEESIRELRAAADTREEGEYAGTALLALGGSAFRVREAEPNRYAPLADDLKTRLLAAQARKEPGGERVALLAIGNARDAGFLPQVTPYLRGGDPAYREIAAGALQHMRGPEVTRLLEERLDGDPEVRVRRAAAKSLAAQPADPQTVRWAIGRMDRETDAAVQTDLARYLGRSAARDPDAREALEKLWTTSDNRDVLRIVRDVRRGRTP